MTQTERSIDRLLKRIDKHSLNTISFKKLKRMNSLDIKRLIKLYKNHKHKTLFVNKIVLGNKDKCTTIGDFILADLNLVELDISLEYFKSKQKLKINL